MKAVAKSDPTDSPAPKISECYTSARRDRRSDWRRGKNVIAIAAGISDGLSLGHNARAALITRGLAEMTRLAVRMKADPLTLAGSAGSG